MKNRIVRDLHIIAHQKDEKDKKLSANIAKATGININDLPATAETVLAHLLHDYSHFSVVTIDSFFQKVIRAFAREMGLFAGYDVELDQASVLEEATNLMVNDIDNNVFLKEWLVDWAKRKIEDGKSWNFTFDVLKLGSEIFSEELQNIEPGLLQESTNKENLVRFRKKLQKLTKDYKDDLQGYGQTAMSTMESYGLEVDHFTQKHKGVGGYFYKLSERMDVNPNTYVMRAYIDIEGWYSKKSPWKTQITEAYDGGLGEILQNAVNYQTEHAREIATATIILKQINMLGVLCDLMNYVNTYTRNQNLFLISEASGFLKKIIADADAPFIYERTGSFYNHFMIDEFQDTSSVQWDNFHPLLSNSIASGYRNWIVGDVKQSIYRWRNTDWKILSEQVEHDLGSAYVQVQNLDKNWRSTPEVIHFNNAFFREAALQMCSAFLSDENEAADAEYLNSLAAAMTEAYRDCYQHLPERKNEEKGYVHLSVITESEKDTEKTWRDQVLDELPHRIEQLQDQGYGLSDIAIIVRENKEAQAIADVLLAYRLAHPDSTYRYDVLSNESLLIGNSPVVKWLVAAIRYIVEPSDQINRAYLQHEYETYLSCTIQPFSFLNDSLFQFRSLPVYELSDQLIRQYNLYQNAGQAPFLQAFQDILLQYTRREATDIRSFLDWWEGEKSRRYVTMPDNQDAIKLITIHKSKGLEFDAVIIPFCDWQMCKSGKTLWCRPDEAPFNDMKLLPLKFERDLRNTIFVKEYLREKMLSYIDNLNLLYVAFTRTRKVLFVSTPQPKKDNFSDVKDLIHKIFHQSLSPTLSAGGSQRESQDQELCYINLNNHWVPDRLCFEFGTLTAKKDDKDKEDKKCIEQATYFTSAQKTSDCIPHITRNRAGFTVEVNTAQIDKGRLLHEIFRNMITVTDLDHCLNTMITEGRLSESERTHIVKMVHRALENKTVSQWFAPDIQVKTEAEILLPNGSIARPDRIVLTNGTAQVIDYKFGEFESEKYRQQVLRYMDYLRQMGYTSVKGFLWYVTLNKVEEVNEKSLKNFFN